MIQAETTITSLIRAAGLGNEEAVERFKRVYVPGILNLCRQQCADEETAQVATQATIATILRVAPTFDRKKHGAFRSYLTKTVLSRIADQKRKIVSQRKREERDWSKRLNQDVVRQALSLAKENSKNYESSWEMFHLHFEQSWSREMIADKFRISPDSVRRTINRCCKKIEEQLELFGNSIPPTTHESDS